MYPLLSFNNMGNNTDKYRITSAVPRFGFAIGLSKAPIPIRSFRFIPECYLRYYRNIITIKYNANSDFSFDRTLNHTDLFLGFGANVLKNISKNNNINMELGLAFELQVTPTVFCNDYFFIQSGGVSKKEKETLYLMPIRCCAKIEISKVVSSKYLIRINTDIPLLLLLKLTNFKQNFIRCSMGYIFK